MSRLSRSWGSLPSRSESPLSGHIVWVMGERPRWRTSARADDRRRNAVSGTIVSVKEVIPLSSIHDQPESWPQDDDVPIEELARRQDVGPIASLDELAQPDLWESEQEYQDFLADLYLSRRSDAA